MFTTDGAEVLSPLHILPEETLQVKARPKLRTQTYPDGLTHTDSHLRVLIPPFATTGSRRRTHSGISPATHPVEQDTSGSSSPHPQTTSTASQSLSGKRPGGMTPIHGATASQRQARDLMRRMHTSPSYHDAVSSRRPSLGIATRSSSAEWVGASASTGQEAQTRVTGKLTPLSTHGRRSRSSSSTQDNDSGSEDEVYFTPTKERIQAVEKEAAHSTNASPSASPASSKSSRSRRGKFDLQSTDAIDAPHLVTSPVSVRTPDRLQTRGSEEQGVDASGIDPDPTPVPKHQPALGKRTRALRVTRGAKLMFSPLAVETKRTLAYDDDEDDGEKKQDGEAAHAEKAAADGKAEGSVPETAT